MNHLINFKKQFASDVEEGVKRQTIRPQRKRPIKEGHNLRLYTGLRTKQVKLLGEATCTEIMDICIAENCVLVGDVCVTVLDKEEIEELAKADGFADIESFIDFFRQQYGLPFSGKLIQW